MVRASRTRSTRFSSSSVIVLPRCVKRSSPSSFTTRCTTPTWTSAPSKSISARSSTRFVLKWFYCRVTDLYAGHSAQPGSDSFEIVPNSTLVVNRTAYKNNSNKYTINRKPSSYKEVQTLLKGRGIDLDHNRFLILQVTSTLYHLCIIPCSIVR